MASTKFSILLGCCTALAGIVMSAQAQTAAPETAGATPKAGTLQEVVVTAERRTTNVQKAAVSVSAISGKDLAAQGRYSLRENLQNIVGVSAIDPTSTTSQAGNDVQGGYITIRGVTPNTDPGAGPSVLSAPPTTGVYIDGVYEGIGGNYDIQRVELERGPQGTLFGRSATSGVYSVFTVDPVLDKYTGAASVEFGNYALRHFTGAVNIPLGDVLAARVSADSYRRNGYYNSADGDLENDGARIKLLYKPSDQISALLGAAVQISHEHNGGESYTWPGWQQGNTSVVQALPEPVGSGHNHSKQFWGVFTYNPGFATISFVPTYRTFDQNATQVTSPLAGYNLGQILVTPLDHFLTYELRATSNEDSPIKWQAGTNYYRNDIYNTNLNAVLPHGSQYPIAANGVPVTEAGYVVTSKRTTDYSVFGEATIPVFTSTHLTLGARYDWTTVDIQQRNTIDLFFPGDMLGLAPFILDTLNINAATGLRNYKNFNYKARVEHDLTSHNLVYATVSTGFVPGNVSAANVGTVIPPGIVVQTPTVYDLKPETLTAYEVGSKNRFFGNRAQANVSVYYYDYGGFQTVYDTIPGVFTSAAPIAVPAHNYGFELETLYSLTPEDRVGVNFSYDQSHWVNMPAAFADGVAFKTLRADVVPYTLVANYDHTVEFAAGDSLDLHVDLHLNGPYQAAAQSTEALAANPIFDVLEHVGPQVTANFNATWTPANGRYDITAYVRNFTNKTYANPWIIPYIPGAPASVTTSGISLNYTDPRTMGLRATISF
jgi:iron complex outermembrane receptor protein